MTLICSDCGSDDIRQEISMLVNPNEAELVLSEEDWTWEDYFYCPNCMDECQVEEFTE